MPRPEGEAAGISSSATSSRALSIPMSCESKEDKGGWMRNAGPRRAQQYEGSEGSTHRAEAGHRLGRKAVDHRASMALLGERPQEDARRAQRRHHRRRALVEVLEEASRREQ